MAANGPDTALQLSNDEGHISPSAKYPHVDAMSISIRCDSEDGTVWAQSIDPALLGTPGSSAASNNASYYNLIPFIRDEHVFSDLVHDRRESPTGLAVSSHPSPLSESQPGYPGVRVVRPTGASEWANHQPPLGEFEFTRNGIAIGVDCRRKNAYNTALRDREAGRERAKHRPSYKKADTGKAVGKRGARTVRGETPLPAKQATGPSISEPLASAERAEKYQAILVGERARVRDLLRRLDGFLTEASALKAALQSSLGEGYAAGS